MPLNPPTFAQSLAQIRSDIRELVPGSNPAILGSLFRALLEGFAGRVDALHRLILQAVGEAFPQTATGENLERYAEGITRNPASGSVGQIVFTGTALQTVPLNSALSSASGVLYRTQASVAMASQAIAISSLTSSAGVATAVAAGHLIATGQEITITGAADDEYNGAFLVTVLDGDTFTYAIEGTPNSPTSGTISASYTGAIATVRSEGEGLETNAVSGDELTLSSPIIGVESAALVRFDGITGGANEEDDESLRARILQKRAAIPANFSADTIILTARQVPGVTRVSVRRATPDPGDVTIHFVRDGDSNIIPSGVDVAAVRAVLLEIIPGTMDPDSLIVTAPSPISSNFTFTALSPNTEAMQAAVRATLEAFFEDQAEIGVSISEDTFKAAIAQTSAGNAPLVSFTLSAPAGNITIGADEIGILGDVTFP